MQFKLLSLQDYPYGDNDIYEYFRARLAEVNIAAVDHDGFTVSTTPAVDYNTSADEQSAGFGFLPADYFLEQMLTGRDFAKHDKIKIIFPCCVDKKLWILVAIRVCKSSKYLTINIYDPSQQAHESYKEIYNFLYWSIRTKCCLPVKLIEIDYFSPPQPCKSYESGVMAAEWVVELAVGKAILNQDKAEEVYRQQIEFMQAACLWHAQHYTQTNFLARHTTLTRSIVLNKFLEKCEPLQVDMANTAIVMVQHLIPQTPELIKALIYHFHVDPKKIFLLGKLYSTEKSVTEFGVEEQLRALGVNLIVTRVADYQGNKRFSEVFDHDVLSLLKEFGSKLADDTTKEIQRVLFLDDGGRILTNFELSNPARTPAAKQNSNALPILPFLTHVTLPKNDHCFYAAAAFYLGEDAAFLRRIVAAHLEYNIDEYRDFIAIPAGCTVKNYIDDIRTNQWAGDLEIHILMTVLKRPVVIIGPNGYIINLREVKEFDGEPIFVYYDEVNHYGGLLLTDGKSGKDVLCLLSSQHAEIDKHEEPKRDDLANLKKWIEENRTDKYDADVDYKSRLQELSGLLINYFQANNVKIAAVEQTSAGCDIEVDHLVKHGGKLFFPVVMMAASVAKNLLEPMWIADQFWEKFQERLKHEQKTAGEPIKIGIIGYGKIGRAVARRILKAKAARMPVDLYVYDNNPENVANLPKGVNHCGTIDKLLSASDYFVGCTGRDTFAACDIAKLFSTLVGDKNFFSCSSENKEFYALIHWLKEKHYIPADSDDPLADIHATVRDDGLSSFKLNIAFGGFPYNFSGYTPGVFFQNIQSTLCLLCGGLVQASCVAQIPKAEMIERGLTNLLIYDPYLQQTIMTLSIQLIEGLQQFFDNEKSVKNIDIEELNIFRDILIKIVNDEGKLVERSRYAFTLNRELSDEATAVPIGFKFVDTFRQLFMIPKFASVQVVDWLKVIEGKLTTLGVKLVDCVGQELQPVRRMGLTKTEVNDVLNMVLQATGGKRNTSQTASSPAQQVLTMFTAFKQKKSGLDLENFFKSAVFAYAGATRDEQRAKYLSEIYKRLERPQDYGKDHDEYQALCNFKFWGTSKRNIFCLDEFFPYAVRFLIPQAMRELSGAGNEKFKQDFLPKAFEAAITFCSFFYRMGILEPAVEMFLVMYDIYTELLPNVPKEVRKGTLVSIRELYLLMKKYEKLKMEIPSKIQRILNLFVVAKISDEWFLSQIGNNTKAALLVIEDGASTEDLTAAIKLYMLVQEENRVNDPKSAYYFNAELDLEIGELYLRLNEPAKAKEHFERAKPHFSSHVVKDINLDETLTMMQFAKLCLYTGEYMEAIKLFDESLQTLNLLGLDDSSAFVVEVRSLLKKAEQDLSRGLGCCPT
jgi:hypothetical protein